MISRLTLDNGATGYLVGHAHARHLALPKSKPLLSGRLVKNPTECQRVEEYALRREINITSRAFVMEWRTDEDGERKLKVDHWQVAELLPELPPLTSNASLMTAAHVFLAGGDAQAMLGTLSRLGLEHSVEDAPAGLSHATLCPWPFELESLCLTYYETRSFFDRKSAAEVSIFYVKSSAWGKVDYIREGDDSDPYRRGGTCTLRHFGRIFAPYDPNRRAEYVNEDLMRYAATGEHRVITHLDDHDYLDAGLSERDRPTPTDHPQLRFN